MAGFFFYITYMSIHIVGDTQGARRPKYVEEEVQKRLEEIDRHLGLTWNQALQRYALVCRWHENDSRWEMYRSGEIGKPEDILGWFTEAAGEGDWQDGEALPVDPLALMDKVIEFLGRMDQTRETWKVRMRKAVEQNREQRRRVMKEAQEEMQDAVVDRRKQIFHEPSIRGLTIDATGKIIKEDR